MNRAIPITTLFQDIGGVLRTNGWDYHARKRAAGHFKVEWAEMEHRPRLNFATYEEGTRTLEEYRGREVFYQNWSFTQAQCGRVMIAQSTPYFEMIEQVRTLKAL